VRDFASQEFWEAYERLPQEIRTLADRAFERLKADPTRPSLRFKPAVRYWSVRVGLHYRALAVRDREDFVWFWIGNHADYDRLLK
jgi:hypothetical protein